MRSLQSLILLYICWATCLLIPNTQSMSILTRADAIDHSLVDVDADIAHQELSKLSIIAQTKLDVYLGRGSSRRGDKSHKCTRRNLKVRKEWNALSASERIAYTDAVRCLQQKQAKSPSSWAPGAKTRFDDWVASHISQSLTIHFSGTFLAWHRYYTWQYEQALINECGYNGTQPYWDWAKTARDGVETSSIFDGSSTSMSGNGEKVLGQADVVLGNPLFPPQIIAGPGTGGGCVTTGPFKNMTVNMGPGSLVTPGNITSETSNPLAYNPRCLRRSLTQELNTRFSNATAVMHTLSKSDIMDFQTTMQGYPGSGDLGVHGGGHYTIGGDPGRDFYTSPGDPVFYLHHGMIDRVWWMWQMKDREARTWGANAIAGTGTAFNVPPSANTTFDTVIDLNYAGGPALPMRDLMSTIDGPFCYTYE